MGNKEMLKEQLRKECRQFVLINSGTWTGIAKPINSQCFSLVTIARELWPRHRCWFLKSLDFEFRLRVSSKMGNFCQSPNEHFRALGLGNVCPQLLRDE